jgi:co-chaperonin GroES (HSP10)
MTDEPIYVDSRSLDADGQLTEPVFTLTAPELSYESPVPMAEYLLIKQNARETTYAGTLFLIPDSARKDADWGVVIECGPDVAPTVVKPGDLVKFRTYNAENLKVNGEDFVLLSVHDLQLRQAGTYVLIS